MVGDPYSSRIVEGFNGAWGRGSCLLVSGRKARALSHQRVDSIGDKRGRNVGQHPLFLSAGGGGFCNNIYLRSSPDQRNKRRSFRSSTVRPVRDSTVISLFKQGIVLNSPSLGRDIIHLSLFPRTHGPARNGLNLSQVDAKLTTRRVS